jgi:iron complex outermembrane receptor protein
VSQPSGSTVLITNAGAAKIKGFELNTDFKVAGPLTISAGFLVLDGKYKNYRASARVFNVVAATGALAPGTRNLPGGIDADGYDILRSPKFTAYVSAEFRHEWEGGVIPATLTYSYKSAFDFDFIADPSMIPYLRQQGYGVLNGRIGYSPPSEKWTLSIWGKNITDTRYFRDLAATSLGVRANYADPATYGAEFAYRF